MENILTDFYIPITQADNIKGSNAYKLAKANGVDTEILEGRDVDPNSGEINFQELDDTDKRVNLRDVLDFVKAIPKDTILGVTSGVVNASDVLNNVTNWIGINPDDTYEFIQEKINKQQEQLLKLEEESPLVNKIMQATPKLFMYSHPIYKKLKRAGVPNTYAFPISVAIGETLAFSKNDTFFVDSKFIKSIKSAVDIEPNSSSSEVYDRLVQAGEYAFGGVILEKIFKGIMAARNIKPETIKKGAVITGGTAIATAAAEKAGATEKPSAAEAETQLQLDNKLFGENRDKILELIDQRVDNKDIAEQLNISTGAVELGVDFYKYGGAGVPLPEFDDKGNMIDDGLYKGEPKGFIKKK